MTKKSFLNRVTNSRSDFLQEFLTLLEVKNIEFCVIGGLALNAYCEPVVSLDLDVVVTASQIKELTALLAKLFSVTKEPHTVNISSPNSDLRIQIQTDPRYQEFIPRAATKTVLGYEMPVASLKDVLQSKIWAYEDTTRRPSKRQKDLADISRLLETYPGLDTLLPATVKKRLSQE